MRKRLYRGVVKRACDDPGCDAPWPCERHDVQPTLQQRYDVALSITAPDVRACVGGDSVDAACRVCGYVVCACAEEPEPEPVTREDVAAYCVAVLGRRMMGKGGYMGDAWELDLDGEPRSRVVRDSDVRAWKAQRGE